VKMKSKKELYNFLLQDCQAYLPPMDATNVYFLKQIMRGAKEVRDSARKSSIFSTSAGTKSWWPRYHRSRVSLLRSCSSSPRCLLMLSSTIQAREIGMVSIATG
jgi:hypothetical protein